MRKLNVLIAGSTGYIGVQLVKLLSNHQNINIKYLCGNSSVGKNISFFDKTLKNRKLPKIVKFNKAYLKNVDIIFTALPNGEAQEISKYLLVNNRLIDLAADFRLEDPKEYKKWYKINHKAVKNISNSIYAIPEISKKYLKNYKIIACPGCYPTSILLPLLPLLKKNLISHKNIIIDSKSGYSGAGRGIHKRNAKKNLYESLSAYGVGWHRHNSEINQEIKKVSKKNFTFIFTPHLTPMFRGILSTIYVDIPSKVSPKKVYNSLKNFYKKSFFVKVAKFNSPISTNNVINTNNCLISICKSKYKNKILVLSVIDNLIKGGSGQAIQNMNIIYNFPESRGLK
jgi:N-acetyl-gamma-glutamyl-phosphate reductase